MGPWSCRIFCAYLDRLRMVDCAGGYYGASFKGFQGVNQVDPLPLTIFNIVVKSVVWHWIFLVSVGTRGQYGWEMEVLHCAAFLYTDDGLVVFTDPVYLQGAFDTMTRLFDGVRWEDVQYDLQPLLRSGDPEGSMLRLADEWVGNHILVHTEVKGKMP